jgi:hypothetical protein
LDAIAESGVGLEVGYRGGGARWEGWGDEMVIERQRKKVDNK